MWYLLCILDAQIVFMRFITPLSVAYLAEIIGAEIIGDATAYATGINEIHKVETGDICFVDHPKYYNKCLQSNASFIIINSKDVTIPAGKTILVCSEPFEAYLTIVQKLQPFVPTTQAIATTATIGSNVTIQPNVFIGEHVVIGNNVVLHANVSIQAHTVIGNNVVIQSGTTIGSDAFYYNGKKNREVWYKRMDSCGYVHIEDDVEIGANCTIDRGVTHITKIGAGTKIDNLVHIGHDVVIGKNCLLASQVGIAGATELKDGVILWGQVGVNKTITLGENAVVMGQAGVTNSIEGNQVYMGTPAIPAMQKRREFVWVSRIEELWKKMQ
jgi:UDP-3-O-[3-hydroxymyristoyl] glucosamine N-acyltransferase